MVARLTALLFAASGLHATIWVNAIPHSKSAADGRGHGASKILVEFDALSQRVERAMLDAERDDDKKPSTVAVVQPVPDAEKKKDEQEKKLAVAAAPEAKAVAATKPALLDAEKEKKEKKKKEEEEFEDTDDDDEEEEGDKKAEECPLLPDQAVLDAEKKFSTDDKDEEEKNPKQVVLFGTDSCSDTRRAKELLAKLNVPFVLQSKGCENFKEHPEAPGCVAMRGKAIKISGKRNVPCIVFPDGSFLSEPKNEELEEKVHTLHLERAVASSDTIKPAVADVALNAELKVEQNTVTASKPAVAAVDVQQNSLGQILAEVQAVHKSSDEQKALLEKQSAKIEQQAKEIESLREMVKAQSVRVAKKPKKQHSE